MAMYDSDRIRDLEEENAILAAENQNLKNDADTWRQGIKDLTNENADLKTINRVVTDHNLEMQAEQLRLIKERDAARKAFEHARVRIWDDQEIASWPGVTWNADGTPKVGE
jgi:peptidoglycan hydrolase CwlO-like protein